MRTDVLVTGSLIEPMVVKGMKPRTYDWARPDMFSRDQIRALSLIHERFAEGLRDAHAAAISALHLNRVDQMTFADFRAEAGQGVSLLASAGAENQAANPAPEERRYFAQSRGASVKVDEAAAERIAGEARALETASPFSVILFFAPPGGTLAPFFADRDVLDGRILPALRDAWKQRVRMPVLGERGDKAGPAPIRDDAMILLVDLVVEKGGEKLSLVYPSDLLRKVLRFLS